MHVSITRLRLRSAWLLLPFALAAGRARRAAVAAPGVRHVATRRSRGLTFWTLTGWDDVEAMRAYRAGAAHRAAMPGLARWCDEAAFAGLDHPDGPLPAWEEAARLLAEHGRASRVERPSPRHASIPTD